MKLIDLLVKELPKWGGWPKGVAAVEQDSEGQLFEMESDYCSVFKLEKCDDWIADVVTKQQYEAALAASEGWIEWHGGKCPVDSDAIVEVIYRKQNPYQYNNDRAGDFAWAHDGIDGDIIAYRAHATGINSRANDDRLEQDLNECIVQGVDVPEWNGDGLPPVGVECEFKCATGEWVAVEITAIARHGMCFVERGKNGENYVSFSSEFRPLRTEAEKAREAAETAIRTCLAGTGAGITPMAAKGIYEAIAAGKIPGVKLEGK